LTQNEFRIKYGDVSNIFTLRKEVFRVYIRARVSRVRHPSSGRTKEKTFIVATRVRAAISRPEVEMSYKTRRGLQGQSVCNVQQCCGNLYFPRPAQTLQTCTLCQRKLAGNTSPWIPMTLQGKLGHTRAVDYCVSRHIGFLSVGREEEGGGYGARQNCMQPRLNAI